MRARAIWNISKFLYICGMDKILRLANDKVECTYSADTVVVKWPAFSRIPIRHFIDLYRENRAMYRNYCRSIASLRVEKNK